MLPFAFQSANAPFRMCPGSSWACGGIPPFSGTLPPSFGKLTSLTSLSLSGYGCQPSPVFLHLTSLKTLDLNDAGSPLTGRPAIGTTCIPAFSGRVTSLTDFHFSGGTVTNLDSLGRLPTSLKTLWLYYDGGMIPDSLGNLTALTELYLNIDGAGTIPDSLGRLTSLTTLRLNIRPGSSGISGTIPPSLGDLTTLTHLGLSGIRVSGTIPPALGNLIKLMWLEVALDGGTVDGRCLSGSIPPSLGRLTALTTLSLQHMVHVGGTIPPSFGNLTALTSLSVDGAQVEGTIPPSIGHLTALTTLNLGPLNGIHGQPMTRVEGTIPSSFGNLTALTTLSLPRTNLSGTIPSSLGNTLMSLSVYGTHVSGTIPGSFGHRTNLTDLYLRECSEKFKPIPKHCDCDLTNAIVWVVADSTRLSGSLPRHLGNLIYLTYFDTTINTCDFCSAHHPNLQCDSTDWGFPGCSCPCQRTRWCEWAGRPGRPGGGAWRNCPCTGPFDVCRNG